MGVVVRVLCALLAVLRCARVGDAYVRIWGVAGDEKSYIYDRDPLSHPIMTLMSSYDSKIEIFCSGSNSENLIIKTKNTEQHAECINTTTLKITLNTPETYSQLYTCMDIQSNYKNYLVVNVEPVITVSSTNLIQKRLSTSLNYFVPINEDYEVACTGHPTDPLVLFKNDEEIETRKLNATTIKSVKLRETDVAYFQYHCKRNGYSHSSARVYVEHPPAAADFWCVEYNEQVNCTWTCTSRMYTTDSLLFMSEGDSVLLCVDHSSKKTRLCEWNHQNVLERGLEFNEEISLQLQTCNLFVCNDQWFNMSRGSIMKANPPVDLRILNKSSNKVTVAYSDFPGEYFGKYYYPTNEWSFWLRETRQNIQPIPASSSRKVSLSYPQRAEIEFELPCPGRLYELKVSSKYETTPGNNRAYWSVPASITFRTDPAPDSSDAADPVCDLEPELITNKDSAIYALKLLARDFQKGNRKLIKKVDDLNQKLTEFEEAKSEL